MSPWQSEPDLILGVLTCALVGAYAARISHLAADGRLDVRLALIGAAVILVVALEAVLGGG